MKISRTKLKNLIREELTLVRESNPAQEMMDRIAQHQGRQARQPRTGQQVLSDITPDNPLLDALEILEGLLSEVEIDAGRDKTARVDRGPSIRDIEAAQTAQNYLPELKEAIELIKGIVGGDLSPEEADMKAAQEILSTRMGSYRGTTLPGGGRIK